MGEEKPSLMTDFGEALIQIQKVTAMGGAAPRCLAWPNPGSGGGAVFWDWVITGDLGYMQREDPTVSPCT